ncbi:MAG: hypothetical protein JWR67_3537 [Mucilaginibacter sp.]|nr:hypothetical protein [Mucilaginibacter sp.]
MKIRVLSIAFMISLIAAVSYGYTGSFSGRWSGTIALLYDVDVSMKENNGKVNGIVSTEIGDIPLKEGVINGSIITFKPFSYNGIAVSYVKGKVDGDNMEVVVGFQGTDFKGTLKRVK